MREEKYCRVDIELSDIEALPVEILEIVCRNAEFDDVERLRRASRTLHSKIDHDNVWKYVYGKVPEQKLPIFKYMAPQIKPTDTKINRTDIFGRYNAYEKYMKMVNMLKEKVPVYLQSRFNNAWFKRYGGVIFLCLDNPRQSYNFNDFKNLVRFGILLVPRYRFYIFTDNFLFISSTFDGRTTYGYLFTIADSSIRGFAIRNLPHRRIELLNMCLNGSVLEFRERSDHHSFTRITQYDYYSIDFGKDSDGCCKLLKTGP